ncbi:MAG TPA: Rieske (2Fe-2S) protein [Pseudonocardiaceae bacterium]|nr:Rieske (2Fe-2S) protein [Pseudonocardiaceae bacterium]
MLTSANDVESTPATAVPADVADEGQVSRRNLIRNAAIAGGVVAAGIGLAACSSNSTSAGSTSGTGAATTTDNSPETTTSAGAAPTTTAAATGTPLGSTSSIPVGGGAIFADQKVVVTQPVAGTFKGFSTTCTHLGCQVNKVADGLIQCPCHGSRYSIVDASVKAGPAPKPLPAAKIAVNGTQIMLET